MSAEPERPSGPKRLEDLDAEDLRDLVSDMSALALDLAQHLELSLRLLRGKRKEQALRDACERAFRLYLYPSEGPRMARGVRTLTADTRGITIERAAEAQAVDRLPQSKRATGNV